jgi:hypothetical protein
MRNQNLGILSALRVNGAESDSPRRFAVAWHVAASVLSGFYGLRNGKSSAQAKHLCGGTECVPLIVGMGKAAELARKQLLGYEKKVRPLRDALEDGTLVYPLNRPADTFSPPGKKTGMRGRAFRTPN